MPFEDNPEQKQSCRRTKPNCSRAQSLGSTRIKLPIFSIRNVFSRSDDDTAGNGGARRRQPEAIHTNGSSSAGCWKKDRSKCSYSKPLSRVTLNAWLDADCSSLSVEVIIRAPVRERHCVPQTRVTHSADTMSRKIPASPTPVSPILYKVRSSASRCWLELILNAVMK
jgi:hypothetical protein